jgi:hypothetical protein
VLSPERLSGIVPATGVIDLSGLKVAKQDSDLT